jgi:repressor of nif and glnA expression
MIGQETREVERKVIAILKVLSDSSQPLGGRVIARRLGDLGIDLSERAVRYHLKLTDERGLTHPVGRRDGRSITPSGVKELGSALVSDRVGSVTAKIEMLTYQTSFDPERGKGNVPINISLFPKENFPQAIEAMRETFEVSLSISDLVAVAYQGERLGEVIVPEGKVGFATISGIVLIGSFLKAGIPMDSRFGGILQIRNHEPLRFVDLIEYIGSSLDPSEVFIASKMTSVGKVAKEGDGKILAGFWELPALGRPETQTVINRLESAGIRGLVMLGRVAEPVCETPVGVNKAGMVITDGLNPVATAVEAGIEAVNHAMCGVIDFSELRSFWDL